MNPTELTPPEGTGSTGTDVAIIAAARDEFIRFGVRRANVGDIARRAGVSRVTVHRHFANKTGLLRSVVMAEIARHADDFDRVWYSDAPLAERIVTTFEQSVRELRGNPLLTTVMASEPDAVLAALTTEGAATFEMVRGLLIARVDGAIERGELAPIDSARVVEAVLRLIYTVVLLPYGDVPGRTTVEIRRFAETVLLPLFRLGPEHY